MRMELVLTLANDLAAARSLLEAGSP